MDEDNDYVQNAAFLHERNLTEPLENVLVNLGHSPQLYKDTTRSMASEDVRGDYKLKNPMDRNLCYPPPPPTHRL